MEHRRDSQPEDIALVADQECKVYSKDDAVPEYILRKWYNRNKTGFNMIIHNDKVIGHLNLLPFKEAFLAKYIDGKVIEKEATAEDIFPHESRDLIKDLYVESLAIIHPAATMRGKILLQLLFQLTDIVSRVCPPEQIRYVYALAATDAGQRVLSDLGFSEVNTGHARKDLLIFFSIESRSLTEKIEECSTNAELHDILVRGFRNVPKGGL